MFIILNKKTLKITCLTLLFLIIVAGVLFPSILQKMYPLKYWDEIKYYSKEENLDPFLVISLTKVESKFDPNAVSKRGAKGLMQLMPETAFWIAQQMGVEYDESYLFDPRYNIQLGCWYLKDLNKQFDGNLNLVLAAYNGGRGNVVKWLKENVWNGKDTHIKNIPFKETKQFVKKVKRNYKMYKMLYGRKKEGFL